MYYSNALFQDVAYLFGGKGTDRTPTIPKEEEALLFEENRKHGLSLTLPRSHSSVFHAGVIGQGLRKTDRKILLSHVSLQAFQSNCHGMI